MKFESIKEIELALHKIDLERQIGREEIKKRYFNAEQQWFGWLKTMPTMKLISQISIKYLIKRITK